MCFSRTTLHQPEHLPIPHISNLEDLIKNLFVIFDYLQRLPVFGDYEDNYEGHIIVFDDLEITFFSN